MAEPIVQSPESPTPETPKDTGSADAAAETPKDTGSAEAAAETPKDTGSAEAGAETKKMPSPEAIISAQPHSDIVYLLYRNEQKKVKLIEIARKKVRLIPDVCDFILEVAETIMNIVKSVLMENGEPIWVQINACTIWGSAEFLRNAHGVSPACAGITESEEVAGEMLRILFRIAEDIDQMRDYNQTFTGMVKLEIRIAGV